jgi:hypothetical protein
MKVRALVSFSDGVFGVNVEEGQVFDLPHGTDWLQAGLVAPVTEERESAMLAAPERAVKKTAQPRKVKGD